MSQVSVNLRVWACLSALERDAREIIATWLLGSLPRVELFGALSDPLFKRWKSGNSHTDLDFESAVFSDLLAELYFSETFEILIRHRRLLPSDLETDSGNLRAGLPFLSELRNSLAHQWPLTYEEPERFFAIVGELKSPNWSEIAAVKSSFSAGKFKASDFVIPTVNDEVLNNLPRTEHGDTGLIGRSELVKSISTLLESERVVTIVGEGGIGKTALALQVAYEFVRNEDRPFESVHWMSLKTEALTVDGIKQIAEGNRNISDGLGDLAAPIENDFRGRIADLADVLAGTRALICIDNLETSTGEEFLFLYDSLPKSVSYLVTSRRGIGQLERRVPVGPLANKDALHLLNRLIRDREVTPLQALSAESRLSVVETFNANPLAIKWFVLSCEAGKTVQQIKEHRADFLDFCIKSVVVGVSQPAKAILGALTVAKRQMAIDEIVVATKLMPDVIFPAVRELTQSALVTSRIISFDPPSEQLEIATTVREFILTANIFGEQELAMLGDNLQMADQDENRRQFELETQQLSPWAMDVSLPQEKAIASLLRQAMRAGVGRDTAKALELVASARKMNASYFEVDKVEGWIRSFTDTYDVSIKLYNEAISKCSNAFQQARVKHLLSALEFKSGRYSDAIRHSRETHEVLATPETSNQLGYFLVGAGSYSEGVTHLQTAFDDTSPERKRYFGPALMRGLVRWGTNLSEEIHNPREAFLKFDLAFQIFMTSQAEGFRSQDWNEAYSSLLYSAGISLRAAKFRAPDLYLDVLEGYEKYLESFRIGLADPKYGSRISSFLDWLSKQEPSVAQSLSTMGRPAPEFRQENEFSGSVLSTSTGYGFIKAAAFSSNVFFPGSALTDGTRLIDIKVGDAVEFTIEGNFEADNAKPRASIVKHFG